MLIAEEMKTRPDNLILHKKRSTRGLVEKQESSDDDLSPKKMLFTKSKAIDPEELEDDDDLDSEQDGATSSEGSAEPT